jgi:hypothetical protein
MMMGENLVMLKHKLDHIYHKSFFCYTLKPNLTKEKKNYDLVGRRKQCKTQGCSFAKMYQK